MGAATRTAHVSQVGARPWSVKLYVATVLLSWVSILAPGVSHSSGGQMLLSLLLLFGVWAGSRLAWALTLAWLSFGVFAFVVSAASGEFLVVAGVLATWIGLLLLAPTRRWVGAPHPELRAGWDSRPMTLRIYFVGGLAAFAYSVLTDPRTLDFPWFLISLISLGLLLMLWSGSTGVWWWSVIVHGISAAVSLVAAFNEPAGWIGLGVSASALALLVAPATRAWFNRRIEERFP